MVKGVAYLFSYLYKIMCEEPTKLILVYGLNLMFANVSPCLVFWLLALTWLSHTWGLLMSAPNWRYCVHQIHLPEKIFTTNRPKWIEFLWTYLEFNPYSILPLPWACEYGRGIKQSCNINWEVNNCWKVGNETSAYWVNGVYWPLSNN